MAQTRAQVNRKKRNEELRDKFKVLEYIRQLEICYKEYETILKDLTLAKTRKAKLTPKEREKLFILSAQIDILTVRLSVIKAKVDLNLRRLKFVLPELRSVSLTDENGNNPLGDLAEALMEAVSGSR